MRNCIRYCSQKWNLFLQCRINSWKFLHPQDDTMIEMRRLCLERRREKGPVKRKTPSIALHRARQKVRLKQAILRCKEATRLGAPSRLKGRPPQTRAPILERVDETGRTEKVEHPQGRTDTVYDHFKELFTDPSHAEAPEWIGQRWLWGNSSFPSDD